MITIHYLDPFKTWLKEEGKKPLTIQEYVRAVNTLSAWYEEMNAKTFNPKEITTSQIYDWRDDMQIRDKLHPATINKRLAALKVYWSFLIDKGITQVDIMQKVRIKRPNTLQQAPKWLTDKEVQQLLLAVEQEKKEWKRKRDKAMILFMLKAGLRISEVKDLDLGAVDTKYWRVTVTAGKGGKWRLVPMNPDLVDAFQGWIDIRGDVKTDQVFTTRSRTGLSRQGIHDQLKKYFNIFRDKNISAHSLRHTFCKSLIDKGISIQNVASLAGHESIETTRRYTTPSEHDLRKAVESISDLRE